jgi:hypothetical protein
VTIHLQIGEDIRALPQGPCLSFCCPCYDSHGSDMPFVLSLRTETWGPSFEDYNTAYSPRRWKYRQRALSIRNTSKPGKLRPLLYSSLLPSLARLSVCSFRTWTTKHLTIWEIRQASNLSELGWSKLQFLISTSIVFSWLVCAKVDASTSLEVESASICTPF